jgi:Cu(I)/Ag(I) efflux system membrane fusion protein
MTMAFGKADAKAFTGIRPGETVRFEFRKGGPMDYELVSVQRTGSAK